MQAEGHPVAMKRDAKEGLSTWVCGYSLLAGGQGNEEKVYDYINAFLDDDTAEYLVTEWGYGHANQAAMERIDQETLASMTTTISRPSVPTRCGRRRSRLRCARR